MTGAILFKQALNNLNDNAKAARIADGESILAGVFAGEEVEVLELA